MRNHDTRNLVLLYEGGKVGILAQDREACKVVRYDLVAFIHKAHHPLATRRSVLEVFGHLAARLGRTEHQDVVRAITQAEQARQAEVNEHAETGHKHHRKPTVDKYPRESGAIQVAFVQRLVRENLPQELRTEKPDDDKHHTDDYGTKYTQNLVSSRKEQP